MNAPVVIAQQQRRRNAVLSYLSLFSSVGTLLCCALPSLLVLIGLGATVASFLSAMPWLVTLSRHKVWTFSISGLLIAASFAYTYAIAPKLQLESCDANDPSACQSASRFSKAMLWLSALLYAIGFSTAFILGPVLSRLDQ